MSEDIQGKKRKAHPNSKPEAECSQFISITMDRALAKKLKSTAKACRANRSWLIRQFINEGFKNLTLKELRDAARSDSKSITRKELTV